MSVICCLLSVFCYMLSVICCLVSVVCYLLSVFCCLLSVVCYLLSVNFCLLSVACYMLSVICCLLSVVCYLLSVICCLFTFVHCLLSGICSLMSLSIVTCFYFLLIILFWCVFKREFDLCIFIICLCSTLDLSKSYFILFCISGYNLYFVLCNFLLKFSV